MSCFIFFFFKQKTAYEMRISDWSSDVCSSDLSPPHARRFHRQSRSATLRLLLRCVAARFSAQCNNVQQRMVSSPGLRRGRKPFTSGMSTTVRRRYRTIRSEEHTSELQSLMRISYAVFCLKKKQTNKT